MSQENNVTIQHTDNTNRASIATAEVTHDQLPNGRYPKHHVSTESLTPYESNRYEGGPIVQDFSKYNTTPKAIITSESEVYDSEGSNLEFHATNGMTRNFRNAEPHDLVKLPSGMELKVEQAIAHGMIVQTNQGYALPGQPQQQPPQQQTQPQKTETQPFIELDPNQEHSLANETMQQQTEAMREYIGDDKYDRYAELLASDEGDLDDVIDALGDELNGDYDYAELVTTHLVNNVVDEGLAYAESRGADREGFKDYLQNHPNQAAVKKAMASMFKTHNPGHFNEFINSYVAR